MQARSWWGHQARARQRPAQGRKSRGFRARRLLFGRGRVTTLRHSAQCEACAFCFATAGGTDAHGALSATGGSLSPTFLPQVLQRHVAVPHGDGPVRHPPLLAAHAQSRRARVRGNLTGEGGHAWLRALAATWLRQQSERGEPGPGERYAVVRAGAPSQHRRVRGQVTRPSPELHFAFAGGEGAGRAPLMSCWSPPPPLPTHPASQPSTTLLI